MNRLYFWTSLGKGVVKALQNSVTESSAGFGWNCHNVKWNFNLKGNFFMHSHFKKLFSRVL